MSNDSFFFGQENWSKMSLGHDESVALQVFVLVFLLFLTIWLMIILYKSVGFSAIMHHLFYSVLVYDTWFMRSTWSSVFQSLINMSFLSKHIYLLLWYCIIIIKSWIFYFNIKKYNIIPLSLSIHMLYDSFSESKNCISLIKGSSLWPLTIDLQIKL